MFITKVNVSNGTDGAVITAESTRTLRSLLDEAGVNYSRGLLQFNGDILGKSALDSTLDDVVDNADQTQILRVTVKADNAADEATATITGGAMVITSTATPEQLKMLKKYRPSALKLYEGEGAAKKEVFMAGIEAGAGCINKYGAIFSDRTDKNGKATITMTVPEDVTDVKEWAADTLGVAILQLRKLEKQFAPMLEDVKQEKEAVAAAICVA